MTMRICFTTQNILPFFDASIPMTSVGGAEMQQYYLGQFLDERAVSVVYLSQDYGQDDIYHVDNIAFFKTYDSCKGVAGLRFFYPRLYRIWLALLKADADIYYTRCASYLPGILAMFCKIYGRKFVFAGAHDTDFMPAQHKVRNARDRFLYLYGIKRADAVIVQSRVQQDLLRLHYHREGHVIRNLYPSEVRLVDAGRDYILWVATIQHWKQPKKFLDLARKLPSERFVMIGGPGREIDFYNTIRDEASTIPNLEFKGFLPFIEAKNFFDRAKVFVNTSEHEGFPNTFLQAWCRGIPVVTFVDPDNLIRDNGLGIVVNSDEALLVALKDLSSNFNRYEDQCIRYFMFNHSPQSIVDQYLEIFQGVSTSTFGSF